MLDMVTSQHVLSCREKVFQVLVHCTSLLVVPVGSPSVSLPFDVQEDVLFPMALLNHVLLHWLSGPSRADFFLHGVGDGPSWEMQLDSTVWWHGNHSVVFVGVSCHVVPSVCRHQHSAVLEGTAVHTQSSCLDAP